MLQLPLILQDKSLIQENEAFMVILLLHCKQETCEEIRYAANTFHDFINNSINTKVD